MAFTTVMDMSQSRMFQDYTLEAKEALIAAFEQGRGNFNTWDYGNPSDYPIRETQQAFTLGKYVVLKK